MNPMVLVAPCAVDVSAHAGTFVNVGEDWLVVDTHHGTRVDILKPCGKVLLKLWRKAIPEHLCDLAEKCYVAVGKNVSTNRGYAAGATKRDQKYKTFEKGGKANSGIMGFMDSPNMTHPCRQTQFTRKHFDKYSTGLPFIYRMDECFATLVPDAHLCQKNVATKTPFHIQGTAFSTITVNYNFQTALHVDSGDFHGGFGTIAVCQKGVQGGWVLFPGFKVAVVMDHGDFMAMDVHEWHCNSPIQKNDKDAFRLSFVGYLREKMVHCEQINARIALASGTHVLTSDRMITDICEKDGAMGDKQVTGTGSQGHVWWHREGQRYSITYKFKRYVIHDKMTQTKYARLTTAWEEILQH